MKFLAVFVLHTVCVQLVFGGCHSDSSPNSPGEIGFTTSNDVSWADADSGAQIYAAVYRASGGWSQWRKLDNSGCDDFEKGHTDYFNDLASQSRPWRAMALYNCGTDGWLIDDVYYWTATSNKHITQWDNQIYSGVFRGNPLKCVRRQGATFTNFNLKAGEILLDNGATGCDGVVFTLPSGGGTGGVWTGDQPDRPDCSGEYGGAAALQGIPENEQPQQPEPAPFNKPEPAPINEPQPEPVSNTMSEFEERLLNYLMGTVAIAALLFVSNSCLITAMVRNSNKGSGGLSYGKVVDDIE